MSARSEDSDQPGHPPSLIRVFACAKWVAKDPSLLQADSEFLPMLYRKKYFSADLLACYTGSDYWAEEGGGGTLTFACYRGSDYILELTMWLNVVLTPG